MTLVQASHLQLWMRAGLPAHALGRCIASTLDGLVASASTSGSQSSAASSTSSSQAAGLQHGVHAWQHGAHMRGWSGLGTPRSTYHSFGQSVSPTCQYATAASRKQPTSSSKPAPGSSQPAKESKPEPAQQQKLDMESLMKALITPLPYGSQRSASLNHAVVELNGVLFPDPAKTLQSVMRTLFAVQQVLRGDGHVGIISPNPLLKPLIKEAALHCTNPNLWWCWQPGDGEFGRIGSGTVMRPGRQPIRKILASRRLTMVNGHSAAAVSSNLSVDAVMQSPAPRLDEVDKWRLFSRRPGGRGRSAGLTPRELLRSVVDAETRAARIPLPGAPRQPEKRVLQLMVVLDTMLCQEILNEAAVAGVLTCGVVDAHSPLKNITYPIYGNGTNPGFVHFLLDWLLKVANMPPAPTSPDITK